MAHTLVEQTVKINNTETFNAWLTETLGYTLADDGTAYSPKDPTFGIKFTMTDNSTGDGTLKITYDGGKTYATIFSTLKNSSVTRYHISKNENVIYWRVQGRFQGSGSNLHTNTYVIAHTDNGKTVFFSSASNVNSSGSPDYNNYVWKANGRYHINRTGRTNSALYNSISRCPAFIMEDVCTELYLVNSIQTFADLQRTFIIYNGQFYRVVSCLSAYDSSSSLDKTYSDYPCFAFPVSD